MRVLIRFTQKLPLLEVSQQVAQPTRQRTLSAYIPRPSVPRFMRKYLSGRAGEEVYF